MLGTELWVLWKSISAFVTAEPSLQPTPGLKKKCLLLFSRQKPAMYSRLAFSLCSAGLLPSTTVQRSPSLKDGFTGCRFQGWCLLSHELVPLPLCWITGLCCFMWFFQFRRIMGLCGCGFAGWLFNSFLEFSLHLNFLPVLAFPLEGLLTC